jgi:hypothetical protein
VSAKEHPEEMAYGVNLRIFVNEERGELRVPPLVVGSSNSDAFLQSQGKVVERALRGSLVDSACLVDLDVEEVGSFGHWMPSIIIAFNVGDIRACVRCAIVTALQDRCRSVEREGSKKNLVESHLDKE